MPVVLGPVGPNLQEIVSWIDSNSARHVLTNGVTVVLMVGRHGWWAPTSRVLAQDLALQPGAAFRSVKDLTRTVTLPLFIDAENAAAARDALRVLGRWFDPTAGEGWLEVDYGDAVRRLRCRPQGFEAAEDLDAWTTPRRCVASLLALHPYWQDADATEVTFAPAAGAGSFFPFPPLRLSPSALYSQQSVSNPGDVESWPIWTIDGPAADLALTNVTTGAQFALRSDYSLAAGDQLTIDTRPLIRSVTDRSGNNVFGYQKATSELWPLIYGSNDVRVQCGNTDASTLVTLSYTPEYRLP